MMKSRRIALLVGLLSLLLVSATACGASDYASVGNSKAYGTKYSMTQESVRMDEGNEAITDTANNNVNISELQERKVIRNMSFSLQTKDYDDTLKRLEERIQSLGGYIECSDSYGDSSRGEASCFLTIRIPEDYYEEFKAFVPTLGNVTSSSEGGDDVTTQYYDTDARLRVLQAQEERILELLEEADTVEEMLQIENELTRIRTEIEQLTTTLKRYDDMISYSTFRLDISQAAEYIVPEAGFGTRLLRAVRDSGKTAVEVLQSLIIFLIWALPYLVVIGVIVVIVLLSVRRRLHRQKQVEPKSAESVESAQE